MYTIITSANSWHFYFSSNLHVSYLLLLSHAVIRISSTVLDIVRVGILLLFLILGGRLFTTEYDVTCRFTITCPYYVDVCSPISTLSFYHEWILKFVKWFFCVYWNNHVIFTLPFVDVVYHVGWFVNIELSYDPGVNTKLIMVYHTFYILLNLAY